MIIFNNDVLIKFYVPEMGIGYPSQYRSFPTITKLIVLPISKWVPTSYFTSTVII